MKPKTLLGASLAATLLVAVSSGCTTSQAKLEAQAKVAKGDAQNIALAKVPGGTVKQCELEKEKGKLIWSFDIETPGSQDITEVQVDAKTGEIVSIENETPKEQQKEAEEEAKEKK
jgi:uncharacterized membrane protein YkoI